MFERFTERARQVVVLAQEEARALKHNYIGTEHLLLGLLREEEGIAAQVLNTLDVTLDEHRIQVAQIVGQGDDTAAGQIPFTPRAKKVLELAVDEARRMGHHYIGTEHLLLGLVRQPEGVAIDVLKRLGVSPEEIRRQTRRALQESPMASAGRSESSPSQEPRSSSSSSLPRRRGESKTPLVDQLATDLTAKAEAGELDPVIGRETEIERVIQILSRRNKNNPALIGEPGVGKTAIVEGLAQRIVAGETPRSLHGKRVLQLDVGSLVAGTMYRGQFEERLKRVIEELKSSDSILFIDEVHMLVGAGSAGSSVDAANILKPALSRGELQCIGATTLDEYRKHIESDAALERRFQPVYVAEPSIDETIQILQGLRPNFEAHHNLEITDEAIEAAARLSARYVTERFMPDKAIDLVDEGSARVRMYKSPESIRVRRVTSRLEELHEELEDPTIVHTEEELANIRREIEDLEDRLAFFRNNWNPENNMPRLNAEDVAEVVSMLTGIPVTQIAGEESERLLHMEAALHERIIGQDEAIEAISKAVRRARAGLKDPNRPIGSFVFLGPTGVGKTELTKALASFLFGSEDALIQLDMSEFMERHNVARLVGAPPGYVGYEEAGQLTEAIRRRPYSIVVFDEIEKAHPEAFNMLLQIMEEGRLSDARGHKVDFRNAIIVMTSNIGAEMIRKGPTLGFGLPRDEQRDAAQDYEEMRKTLLEQLRRVFRPEFVNRLDAVIVFRPLTREDIGKIVDLRINEVRERVLEHALLIDITPAARQYLADKGFDPEFGARPLRRVITNLVEDRLSDAILSGRFPLGSTVVIDYDAQADDLVFEVAEGEVAGETSTPLPSAS
jgi:ATP-dependent Clp protease ATP-binding subunit ClpC